MTETADTTELSLADLAGELRALTADAEKLPGHTLAGQSNATLALRDRIEAAKERLTQLTSEMKPRVVARAKHTDGTIRRNPYEALAVALGAGLLLGVFLIRRRTYETDTD